MGTSEILGASEIVALDLCFMLICKYIHVGGVRGPRVCKVVVVVYLTTLFQHLRLYSVDF
jgi:hypothetical protein